MLRFRNLLLVVALDLEDYRNDTLSCLLVLTITQHDFEFFVETLGHLVVYRFDLLGAVS